MMRFSSSLKAAASTAALLLAVCTAAHAQTYYSTDFDSGTDTVNNSPQAANYKIYPASSPTNPLDNLNGWASNDGTVIAGTSGTSQVVGRSDYVGKFGSFFGGTTAGALGGVYRVANGTTGSPDVVPSTNSGGIVTLYHPVSITPATSFYTLTEDFTLTTATTTGTFATNRDSFGFTLGSSMGNLLSINFTPGANNADGSLTDSVGVTVGSTTTAAGAALTLNTQYHLRLVVTTGAGSSFSGSISNASGSLPISGSLTGSTITAASVSQVGVLWNLLDKTAITNSGYQNAGSNAIAFDNVTFAVPEPSTYAMLALGLVGLGGLLRLRRSQV